MTFMHTPVSSGYGLGHEAFRVGGRWFVGHGGANRGWRSAFFVEPASGDVVVVLTNGDGGDSVVRSIVCEWLSVVTSETPPRCTNPT